MLTTETNLVILGQRATTIRMHGAFLYTRDSCLRENSCIPRSPFREQLIRELDRGHAGREKTISLS